MFDSAQFFLISSLYLLPFVPFMSHVRLIYYNVCCLWQCIFWGSYFLARIKNVIGDIILNNVIKFKKNHTNQYANHRIKVIINFLNLGPPLCFRCIEERSTLVIILMLIFLIKNELFWLEYVNILATKNSCSNKKFCKATNWFFKSIMWRSGKVKKTSNSLLWSFYQ